VSFSDELEVKAIWRRNYSRNRSGMTVDFVRLSQFRCQSWSVIELALAPRIKLAFDGEAFYRKEMLKRCAHYFLRGISGHDLIHAPGR